MFNRKVAILLVAFLLWASLSPHPTYATNAIPRQPLIPVVPAGTKSKPSTKTFPFSFGHMRDWFGYVDGRFSKSVKYRVVDFDTKLSYDVIRVGGHLHADVEPATAADTQIMYRTLGCTWNNWRRRALIIFINGEAIAASLYGEPHGYETIPNNNMNGQVCIHFLNSRTHGTNRVDGDHQYQIKRAAGLIK